MTDEVTSRSDRSRLSGISRRLGRTRRRLLLLAGVGAAVAAKVATDAASTVQAAGRVIGAPLGYTPYDAQSDGVQGYAVGADNAGTLGRNNDLNGVGVYGVAPNGTGVHGESATGTAVGARSASGRGVYGESISLYGVVGKSTSSHGVVGLSGAANATGVYGWTDVADGIGVFGQAGPTGTSGYAAKFEGPVQVHGSFLVWGGAKNAAVPHPDGTHRRLYCVEATESYFEDIGRGQLTNGRGQVQLDQDFAAVVRTDGYEVFLTPRGDCRGLYIASQTATGFEVRELQGGTSTLTFSYRIMANRKDITAPRMERIAVRKPTEVVTRPTDPTTPTTRTP